LKDNPSDLVIIDSVSVISSNDISGTAGSISQVKYIAEKLMNYAKKNKLAMILIGHVTKD
jgi:DNA repair protein RadA/Sms